MQVVRGSSESSGGRVSNTWAICLIDRDNAWKRVLIPDRLLNRMIREGKLLLQHDQMSPRRIS
jgi:hypothetical protein